MTFPNTEQLHLYYIILHYTTVLINEYSRAVTSRTKDTHGGQSFEFYYKYSQLNSSVPIANVSRRLTAFCSHFGADFYGLPRNEGAETLIKETWLVPESYAFGKAQVVPLRAGQNIAWQMVEDGKRPCKSW